MDRDWVPLVRACAQARISYSRVMRLILVGAWEARQLPNGRWQVSRASVRRHAAERRVATESEMAPA
jgi:hypothetical protein